MDEVLFITLFIRVIFGIITCAIAMNRGRSAVGWFFGGFFLAFLATIIVLVLPNLKEQAAKEEAIARENRRLREQLLQEQMKSEAFRQHAAARLDAHDTHLGLDTRAASPALTGPTATGDPLPIGAENWPSQQPANGDPASAPQPAFTTAPHVTTTDGTAAGRQWYYNRGDQPCGPVDESTLLQLVRARDITAKSLLWTPLLTDWKPAAEFDFLRPWLST